MLPEIFDKFPDLLEDSAASIEIPTLEDKDWGELQHLDARIYTWLLVPRSRRNQAIPLRTIQQRIQSTPEAPLTSEEFI